MFLNIFVCAMLCYGECANVVTLEKDFSNINKDVPLTDHVNAILERLKTFKIPHHPRVRLFYELLKKGISSYTYGTSDSLYKPDKYNEISVTELDSITIKDEKEN